MKITKAYTHYSVWHRPDYLTSAVRWGIFDTMQEAKAAIKQLKSPTHYPQHMFTIEKMTVYTV